MFIKVPQTIFEQKLTPNELKLYLYLSGHCCNCMGVATVRIATLQDACGIASAATVRTALRGLGEKNLLTSRCRRNAAGDYISSEYTLTPIDGAWFALDMDTASFRLEKSCFAALVYLSKLCRENRRAWPSYSMIAAAIGLTRKTVIAAIAQLVELGALAKAALRAGKHNLYELLHRKEKENCTENTAKKEEAAALVEEPQPQKPCQVAGQAIVARLRRVVNMGKSALRFLTGLGGVKIVHQYLELSCIFTLKKGSLLLSVKNYGKDRDAHKGRMRPFEALKPVAEQLAKATIVRCRASPSFLRASRLRPKCDRNAEVVQAQERSG